jgi:hypothetical protein
MAVRDQGEVYPAGLPGAARPDLALPHPARRPRAALGPVDGIIVDLRPGGRFEMLMLGPHGSYRMVATFTEIVAPERLAWIEPSSGMHTTSALDELDEYLTQLMPGGRS